MQYKKSTYQVEAIASPNKTKNHVTPVEISIKDSNDGENVVSNLSDMVSPSANQMVLKQT